MPKDPYFRQKDFPATMVAIPAWNESKSIQAIVKSIKDKYTITVLVVDDGSEDNTGDLAENAGARVLRLPMNMGAWTAIQAGFRYALSRGYASVVTMDADGQHFAESIPKLVNQLAGEAADVVIGSHVARGNKNRQISWSFFRLLTGLDIRDFTSGLKIYNRRAMALLLSPRAHLFDYQDLGALLLLRRYGMKIREIEVPMQERKHGRSKIFFNWRQVIKYMILTTVLCVSKYRHHSPDQSAGKEENDTTL